MKRGRIYTRDDAPAGLEDYRARLAQWLLMGWSAAERVVWLEPEHGVPCWAAGSPQPEPREILVFERGPTDRPGKACYRFGDGIVDEYWARKDRQAEAYLAKLCEQGAPPLRRKKVDWLGEPMDQEDEFQPRRYIPWRQNQPTTLSGSLDIYEFLRENSNEAE